MNEEKKPKCTDMNPKSSNVIFAMILAFAAIAGLMIIISKSDKHGNKMENANAASFVATGKAEKAEKIDNEIAKDFGWCQMVGPILTEPKSGISYCLITTNGNKNDIRSYQKVEINLLAPGFQKNGLVYVVVIEFPYGHFSYYAATPPELRHLILR